MEWLFTEVLTNANILSAVLIVLLIWRERSAHLALRLRERETEALHQLALALEALKERIR